jgi:pyridoxal phosphate enzyme (YggS family)
MSEIADRIGDVRDRIEQAAARSGREADEVVLVAISKTFPESAIREAAVSGITDFGENKAQEFEQKAEELDDLESIIWHFVGHLQRNKAQVVVGRTQLIHSLDSARLARRIQTLADRIDWQADCLIQVNVSDEDTKFGIAPSDLPGLVETIRPLDKIRVRGLMTLASPTEDEAVLRREFGALRELGSRLSGLGIEGAPILSMGMSGDFEIAIEEGATHVRIGSAIFGPRACMISD